MDQVSEKFDLQKVDRNEIDMLRDFDARKIMKHLHIPLWKVPAMSKYVMGLLAEEIDFLSLFEGINQLLQDLSSQGIKLGIVTSNSYENVCKILGPENAALIQYYECGVRLFGKQSKLKKVLKESGVDANEAICIGDEIRDIQAAQKVKIPFGAVAWGYTNVEALKEYAPTEVFTKVAEIAERII